MYTFIIFRAFCIFTCKYGPDRLAMVTRMSAAGTPSGEVSSSSTDEDTVSFDSGVSTAGTISTASIDTTTQPYLATHLMVRPHCNITSGRPERQRHLHHKSAQHSGQNKLPRKEIFIIYTAADLYHVDTRIPFMKRIEESDVTLGYFKEKIFPKKGHHYRFFFKTYNNELDMVVMEDYTDYNDSTLLPVLLEGREKRRVIRGTAVCSSTC